MTLKKQKIVRYIPIIQFIIVFYWIGYYRKNNHKHRDFFKTSLKMIAFLLVVNIPRMILHFIFKNDFLDNVIFYISIYPCFWGVASMAFWDQEQHDKILKSQNINEHQ